MLVTVTYGVGAVTISYERGGSQQGYFVPRETFGNDTLVVTPEGRGATGVLWVESRDAAERPTMNRTPLDEGQVSPRCGCAKVENPCPHG